MKINRRKEREYILQVLYAHEYNSIPYTDITSNFITEFQLEATDFIKIALEKCTNEIDEIERCFLPRLQNWDINRVAVMDKILLRMAVAEFLFCSEIPPEVTINEIIEISKTFSTDRSGKFLNGILDSVLKDLKKKKKLVKTGRGLISPNK